MDIKNSEKSNITAYTKEEILVLIDFACNVSSPDFNNRSQPG